ncbi:antibiotic biosynthesis monooxygenase [Uruburuella testudinis]|uniref:Antibiotic biosynthesis monooxygenase n=1 Tax=Uruburuella testudinis TaxID=1282863 RepID=A0ABY4DQA4_9NEIS|nr:antibiotic biosynthesis monooxygenase [Uruburuella testudinis]UOO81071.1 antibiotic biosynthesis monooxygenase [Uruburuella testudinis]
MKRLKTLISAAALSAAVAAQAAPVVNLFELGVQPGRPAEYNKVGENNIRQSINGEPGTLVMHALRHADDANLAYMFEIYADESAYQAHLKSPQYQHFLQQSPHILTEHKKRIGLVPQFLGEKTAPLRLTENMQVNLVTVTLKPEAAAAFAAVVLPEMAQSLKVEDGVLAMYAATDQAEPLKWYFLEIYADAQAYQQHRNTPHFQDYLARTADMSTDKAFIPIKAVMLANKGGLMFHSDSQK